MARKAIWPPRIHRHQTGQARVTYRGRDYYLGPFGSPLAERAYAALLVRLTSGLETGPGPKTSPPVAAPTVALVCGRFLEAALAGKRTGQHCRKAALLPVVRLCGDLPAADFDDLALEKVRAAMIDGSWMDAQERARHERMRWPLDWCRLTVNRHVGRVCTAWRWAERQRLVPRGSWANLRTLPPLKRGERGVRETPKRRGTKRADLDRVLPFVQAGQRRLVQGGPRHRPCATMLHVQYLIGCRSGEICCIRPCDIDREAGPTVEGVKVWIYRPMKYKTEHLDIVRVIAIGPTAQALLLPWLEKCGPEEFVFRPAGASARKPCYSVRAYDATVWRACRKAGVKLIPYGGRRATADRVKKEYGLDAARSILGHTTVGQTADYCELIDMQQAAEIAAKLG